MNDKVNITGIDKGVLLAHLFNGSRAVGMGLLQAAYGPSAMSDDEGRHLIAETAAKRFTHDNARAFPTIMGDQGLYFDYLFGRPLKVDLSGDEMSAWGYDRDNGGAGTLAGVVEDIRAGSGRR